MDAQCFRRNHRLRRRGEFLEVYRQGCCARGRWVAVFCLEREDAGPWRLGLTVTRKAGKAARRNRMRRRAREFFRRRGELIPAGWDFVVNLRRGADSAPAGEFARDLGSALQRLGFDVDIGIDPENQLPEDHSA